MGREERKAHKSSLDKKILKMNRELDKVRTAIWNLGWMELEKPIRSGYERKYVLRQDIAKSKDARFFNGILDLVNSTIVCRDKSFMRKDYKTKKMIPIKHELKHIEKKEYEKLSEKQKSYFSEYWDYTWNGLLVHKGYEVTDTYRFTQSKNLPHYITKVPIRDEELEQRRKEIEDWFDQNNYWPVLNRLLGVKNHYYDYDHEGHRKAEEELKREMAIEAHQIFLEG